MAVGDVVQGLTGRAGLRGAARGHVRVVGQALASGSASSWAAVERHYIAEGRCSMSMEGGFLGAPGAEGTGRARHLKQSVCAAETGWRRLYEGVTPAGGPPRERRRARSFGRS